jgi:hypothetical protein
MLVARPRIVALMKYSEWAIVDAFRKERTRQRKMKATINGRNTRLFIHDVPFITSMKIKKRNWLSRLRSSVLIPFSLNYILVSLDSSHSRILE